MKGLAPLLILSLIVSACRQASYPPPRPVEVTRELIREVPVTVQVTQVTEIKVPVTVQITSIVEKRVLITVPVTSIVEMEIIVTATPKPSPTQVPVTPTSSATATPVPAPTHVPAPTSIPRGSRSNPVPFGEPHEFVDDTGRRIRLRLVGVASGAEAQSLVNAGGSSGTWSPRGSKEFFTATFEAAYLQGPADTDVSFDYGDFTLEANRQLVVYTMISADGRLNGRYYPGGQTSGWTVFQVPAGAEVTGIYYKPWPTRSEIWFAVQ